MQPHSNVGAGTPANFTFNHQTAKIVVHVRNSGIVAGKTGLGMTVGNGNIYINGNLSTPVNGVYTWTPGDTQGTITPYNLGQQPMSDRTTSLVSFGALVIPQTISEGNTLFLSRSTSRHIIMKFRLLASRGVRERNIHTM